MRVTSQDAPQARLDTLVSPFPECPGSDPLGSELRVTHPLITATLCPAGR